MLVLNDYQREGKTNNLEALSFTTDESVRGYTKVIEENLPKSMRLLRRRP